MTDRAPTQVLIVGSLAGAASRRVLGDGGWTPPAEREVQDWLTLVKLCGWHARVVDVSEDVHAAALRAPALQWIVVACPPESLGEEAARTLEAIARERPLLVVASAAGPGTPYARISGVGLDGAETHVSGAEWRGPGGTKAWACRRGFTARNVSFDSDVETWAAAVDGPLVLARRCGRGAIVAFAFDVGEARDADGAATSLLRHALIFGSPEPVAYFDWTGTVVLRMDDPGGAQNVYLRSWRYPKLTPGQWAAIGDELQARGARLSIAYIPAWVDDGDAQRGTLYVDGAAAPRVPGAIYPSSKVSYIDTSGDEPCATSDYRAEHAAIAALRERGLAEVELHGYTHVQPDRRAWLAAPDRYDAVALYRELGAGGTAGDALALGAEALRDQFGVTPTTLVPPGDVWIEEALERALDLGLKLVSSYYLALRHDDRFFWSTHVCAPYLDSPDSQWFDSGLPVVGYFHDKEPATEGVAWFARCMQGWTAAGATRWIDFRELAAATSRSVRIARAGKVLRLHVHEEDSAPALVRALEVEIYAPGDRGGLDVVTHANAQTMGSVERIDAQRVHVRLFTAAAEGRNV